MIVYLMRNSNWYLLFGKKEVYINIDFIIVYVYDNLHSFCQYLFLNLTYILLGKGCVEDINSFYHKQLNGKFIIKNRISRSLH